MQESKAGLVVGRTFHDVRCQYRVDVFLHVSLLQYATDAVKKRIDLVVRRGSLSAPIVNIRSALIRWRRVPDTSKEQIDVVHVVDLINK